MSDTMERPRQKLGVARLTPQQTLLMWADIEPHLAKACARSGGRFTAEWVRQNLVGEFEHQVWAILSASEIRGAMATTVQIYPATGLTAVQALLIGGDGVMSARAAIVKALQRFRDERGAHIIEWWGRKGFSRLMPGAREIGCVGELR